VGVHWLCRRLQASLVSLHRSNVVGSLLGASERNLHSAFRAARQVSLQSGRPAVVFIDELDGFFGQSRGEGSQAQGMYSADAALMSALMQAMDAAATDAEAKVLVVAATNVADTLDPALQRRLANQIHFPLPDRPARHAAWSLWLDKTPAGENARLLEQLAESSEGLSYAHIEEALGGAVRRTLAAGEAALGPHALLDALSDTQRGRRLANGLQADALVAPAPDTTRLVAVPEPLQRYRRDILARAHARPDSTTAGERLHALAYGPPGTGKTAGVYWLAKELGAEVFSMSLAELASLLVVTLKERFEALGARAKAAARATGRPAIVLLEELDCLLEAPSHPHRSASTSLALVLSFLDAMPQGPGACVLVVATSNAPEAIDRAVLRRLHVKLPFPLPDAGARAAFFARRLAECGRHQVGTTPRALAELCQGLSFDELESCMVFAARRARDDDGARLSDRHLLPELVDMLAATELAQHRS
jgi:SpoVK/Ycf46/Vps4 family AAA+-type ATPase